MNKIWYFHLLWLPAIAFLSFAIPAVFVGIFRLPRPAYLIPYIGLVGTALYLYTRWSGLDLGNFLRHNW